MGLPRPARRGIARCSVAAWALVLYAAAVGAHAQANVRLLPFVVVGDAIPLALTNVPGDPMRGRAIVANRQVGLCMLCHTGPIPEERFQGSLAPDLTGAGTRWTVGQLRLRMVDARALNPQTIMPSYHRMDGLNRVAAAWTGVPMLGAQQVEDVVAYLATLRD